MTLDIDDIKVLCNDWPYGIDSRITHLVVWTKFDLEEDPQTGDLTPTARALIDQWVEKNIRNHVANDKVCITESAGSYGRSRITIGS